MTAPPPPPSFIRSAVPPTSHCFLDGDRQEQPLPIPTLPAPDLEAGAPLSASRGSLQARVGGLFLQKRMGWLSAPALAPLGTVGTVEAKLRLGQEMSH